MKNLEGIGDVIGHIISPPHAIIFKGEIIVDSTGRPVNHIHAIFIELTDYHKTYCNPKIIDKVFINRQNLNNKFDV